MSLFLGFISGALASVVNIPFDVAKSRIQGPQPPDNPLKYSTTTATLQIIVREEGYIEKLHGFIDVPYNMVFALHIINVGTYTCTYRVQNTSTCPHAG